MLKAREANVTVFLVFLCGYCVSALFRPSGAYRVDGILGRRLNATLPKHRSLGGRLNSCPACVSSNRHEIHCFFLTDDNAVGYALIDGNNEAEFKTFEGSVKDAPQVVGYGAEGAFALFITERGEIAVVAVKTATQYDDQVTVLNAGAYLEAPGCTMMGSIDDIFCIMRSTLARRMYAMRNRNGRWEKPFYVSQNPDTPLGCAYNKITTNIHCWATQLRHLVEVILTEKGHPRFPIWLMFSNVEAKGRVMVKMLHNWLPLARALGYWHNEMVDYLGTFKGHLLSEPDCVQSDSNVMECFALDEFSGIQCNYQLMGAVRVIKTSGWVHYPGKFVGKPSCVYIDSSRQIHCFIRNYDDTLVEVVFDRRDVTAIDAE